MAEEKREIEIKVNTEQAVNATEGLTNSIDNLSGGAVSSFKGIFDSTKTMVKGFGALKTAWIATGFGALAVLVLSLVEYFKNFDGGIRLITKSFNVFEGSINAIVGSFDKLLSGDILGFFNSVADGAKSASEQTDKLYKAQDNLYKLQLETTEENSRLEVALERNLKILEDTTRPVNERLEAQRNINILSEKLLINKAKELQANLDILNASIALENNDEKRRELNLKIVDLKAQQIKAEGEIEAKKAEGGKKLREIVKSEQDRIKAIKDKSAQEALKKQEQLLKAIEDRYNKISSVTNNLIGTYKTLTDFITGSLTNYGSESQKLLDILASSQSEMVKLYKIIENDPTDKPLADLYNRIKTINTLVKEELNIREQIYKQDLLTSDNGILLTDLEGERLKRVNELSKAMFEFEKSVDGRLDNSNKYNEIISKTSEIYKLQKESVSDTYNTELKANKQVIEDLGRRKKLTDELIKQLPEIKSSDKLKPLEGETEEQTLQRQITLINERDKLVKASKDLEIQQNNAVNKSVELLQNRELELALLTADEKFEIELNLLEKTKLIRQEKLARERDYYSSVVNIASESAGFLDAMAQHGGKSSEKFAKQALNLRKAAGIASVAISLQEEIRGISANPALTALPDAGATAKGLLIGTAITKAGFSTATILKQRLNGGSNVSGATTTANATPNFNIVESSGNNQLASSIAQQQNQPVQAFVVGSAVTSQQALDRNILNNSTFL